MDTLEKAFKKIEEAKTQEDLNQIWKNELEKYPYTESKYPEINISISKAEIEKLKGNRTLNEDGNFDDEQLKKLDKFSTIEKLLLAMVWKNGDLNKIKHIVSGIEDTCLKETKAKVFTQYGKHLRNPEEPIIDQHVLRAFKYFGKELCEDKVRKSVTIKKSDVTYINEYKVWVNELSYNIDPKNLREIMREIDKLMFVIGKGIKIK